MGFRQLFVGFCLLSVLTVARCAQSGPAYFVSNARSLSLGEPVDYELRSSADFASLLLSSLAGAAQAGSDLPDVLLVLASSEATDLVNVEEVPEELNSLAAVKKAVELSSATTVFTSVGRSCDSASLIDSLASAAGSEEGPLARVVLGGVCSKEADAAQDVKSFVQAWAASAKGEAQGTTLLAFCLPPQAGDGGAAFLQACLALQNATSSFAAVLAPQSLGNPQSTCQRRSLQESLPAPPGQSSCGATCKTKAALWEAMLVTVILLIAVISGLCCLADLDTPSKFETPAEAS